MFDAADPPFPWVILAQPSAYAILQIGIVKPTLGTMLNRDHPFARGLVGCWLFNEAAGKFVWDATGNGTDGTLVAMLDPAVAGSGWAAGLHGGAMAFDGTDDKITANSPGIYSNYSICAQFRLASSVISAQGLVAWGREAASERRSLFLWNGGAGPLKLASSTYASNILGATSLVDGVDYFGVVTVDAVGAAKVYLNGVLDGSGTNTLVAPASNSFTMGAIGIGSFFNGQMSSAFIFDRVLSADEVAALYAFPYAMFEPPGPPYILAPPIAPFYNTSQGMFALYAG